jgi:phospholipid/cholesterol/gamma-HCH transport system substrate-binding protein
VATPARLAGIGVFVLGGLLLFTVGLFMIGDRQMAFAKKFTIYAEFARITGLQPGAIIRVSGAKAGTVKDIIPPSRPSEKFKLKLEIIEDLHPLVRTDSLATIETEGLVGGSFLGVSTGSEQAPPATENSTIAGKEPFAINDLLQQASDTIKKVNEIIDGLTDDIQNAVQSISDTVENANQLIDDVSDDVKTMASAGARIAQDAADIADNVRNGEGTLGKLIKDDEFYRRATSIAKNAEDIANDARQVIQQAKKALDDLQSKNGPVQGLAANVKQTMDDARGAMAGFAENMEALKRNFLFRGFFNNRGFFNLAEISPAQYRQGILTKNGERGVLRVWLGAPVLFEPDPDDPNTERLTEEGKARLDSAIEPYLEHLGNGILMVEGYATQGTKDEQFLRSRARGGLARAYLIGKFRLNPQTTGLMPLGRDSAGSPNNLPWDGIALAAFIDPRSLVTRSEGASRQTIGSASRNPTSRR